MVSSYQPQPVTTPKSAVGKHQGSLAPWPIFDVAVSGWPPFPLTARSRGKALVEALGSYQNYDDRMTLKGFMGLARVRRRREPLLDDGYDYVRRAYDVHPVIGSVIELVNEGPETGRRAVVLYPNRTSTAYVHVGYECGAHVVVHPMNVRALLSCEGHGTEQSSGDGQASGMNP
jgi:hypothetical protein